MSPQPEDFADRHVARWRDHWIDIPFEDDVEAMVVRINQVHRYLKANTQKALAELGLQDSEYDTLHHLMIRDTPGRAAPTELARVLGVTGAGMTSRLDALERRGWVQRTPAVDDRRRVDIEVTKAGVEIWRRAMRRRGDSEDELATALSAAELRSVNKLLKKLTLRIEAQQD
ncbi:MarR family transcriptional regulator [Nocardioides sp. SYSU D00038]|uniref:MarR family winged helix-turn-helix transcriptional regulator n=1 Tax=Nocardioides sp. SYSU D00038 TaxID=2812554 RepID=UPI0027DC6C99|nr:MarR family transcriptional regulator [Nocardioides sp. SYSU D00038]